MVSLGGHYYKFVDIVVHLYNMHGIFPRQDSHSRLFNYQLQLANPTAMFH